MDLLIFLPWRGGGGGGGGPEKDLKDFYDFFIMSSGLRSASRETNSTKERVLLRKEN